MRRIFMSKELNIPPFYPGQKIVRIGKTVHFEHGIVFKDKVYTCAGCLMCNCGRWKVMLLEFPAPENSECDCVCGFNNGYQKYYSGHAVYFAPVVENFQSISLEKILEEETKLISVN